MPWVVALLLACLLAIVAVAALVVLLLDRLRGVAGWVRQAMSVVHGLVAAFVVVDVVTLLAGHRPESMLTHVGYAVAALGLPTLLISRPEQPDGDRKTADDTVPAPATGVADDSDGAEAPGADPPHLGVVAIAAVATAVCVLRLQQTW